MGRLNYEAAFAKAGFSPDGYFVSGSRPPAYLKGMLTDKKTGGGSSYVGAIKI